MNSLIKKIKNESFEYGSIPFWSWNDKLDPEELRRQIREMYALNMKGFFMHARGGLETEYLSEEWYECIEASVDEAKKLGMEAWSYDENGWPSGFAGGKLLEDPDNFAVYVEGEFCDAFPSSDENVIGIYAIGKDGKPSLTESAVLGAEKYLVVKIGFDSSYVDTMRGDITDKFIEATHEEYKKRLADDFGKAMPGFFTDEPQYYRWKTPFSTKMDEWFLEDYGYSVRDALPALFCDYEGAEEYRYDYHKMTTKRFTEGFSKRLYDWHDKNGVQLTGHFVEETTLSGQMMCCGDIMPQYLYEHIPGIDYLGRKIRSDVAPKQLGSVCAQTGRKRVLSEMFGCCGWDITPRELKSIAELQYAGGVNVMCQHLYPYSIRGQRKRDYPAFYSEHSLWYKDQARFNEFFARLGYTLSMGEEYADVLLIHPMRSAWLYFKRVELKTSIADLDDELVALTKLLCDNGIGWHFGSETIMKDLAYVDNDTFVVGKCRYKTVIVPPGDTLDASTVRLLERFKANGGKILVSAHRIPTRVDGRPAALDVLDSCENIFDADVFSALKSNGDIIINRQNDSDMIRSMTRRTEFGRIIYIANIFSKDTEKISVFVKDCKSLARLDLESLSVQPVSLRIKDGGVEAELVLPANASVVLYENNEDLSDFCEEKGYLTLENNLKIEKLPENMLTLDRARVSKDGEEYTDLRFVERIRDELLRERFSGKVFLSFPFELLDIPKKLCAIIEPFSVDELKINGESVKIGEESAIDRSFRKTDITKYLKLGENTLELVLNYWQNDYVYYVLYGGVSETLRNCLVFDTEIENVYLTGDFELELDNECFAKEPNNAYRCTVDGLWKLKSQGGNVDVRNAVTSGYPFYCGELTYVGTLNYKEGMPTALRITGRYMTVKVNVNGKDAGILLLSDILDIREYLKEGVNEIKLTICNNYRNLQGPHHYIEAEPISVEPKTFSFEDKWHNGCCDGFDDGYAFVRFGIDV